MDKHILRKAIIETAEEGNDTNKPWNLEDEQHRALFAQRAIRHYFELMRIELAKDGN
jgi:hypothetical protein